MDLIVKELIKNRTQNERKMYMKRITPECLFKIMEYYKKNRQQMITICWNPPWKINNQQIPFYCNLSYHFNRFTNSAISNFRSLFHLRFYPADPNDPRKVIVKKLALCVPGRDDMELDLSGDISKLKKQVFTIKEGVQYKIRIDFIVQREIVHGLKYVQKTYRMLVPGESRRPLPLLLVSRFFFFPLRISLSTTSRKFDFK